MNEQMESLEVVLGRVKSRLTSILLINAGQALAGQVRVEGDGDAAVCRVR